MSRRRCCCEAGCEIDSDDFNRADSTDLGAKWTEVAGDWEIQSNRLYIDSADAKVTFASTPTTKTSLSVKVDIYLGAETDQAYVGIDDTYYVCVDRGPTDSEWRLRIYSSDPPSGGTIRASLPFFYDIETPDFVTLIVTLSSEWLSAWVNPPIPYVEFISVPIDPADFTSGEITLGTGTLSAGSDIQFNDFVLEDGYETDPTCRRPPTRCVYQYGPVDLPDGTNLDSDDWTTSGTYTISSDAIRFSSGSAYVLTTCTHPFTDATTILDYHWRVVTYWDKVGAAFTGETAYAYFGGSSNYLKMEFIAPTGDGTWRCTCGVYIGGVLSGATTTVEGYGVPISTICVTPTVVIAMIVQGIDLTAQETMAREYTPANATFGAGADPSTGLDVTLIYSRFTKDVADFCEPCAGECTPCEDGVVPYAMQVTISDWAGDTCADCSDLNGVYECVYDYPDTCEWIYEDEVTLCGTTYDREIIVTVNSLPPQVETRVDIYIRDGASLEYNAAFTKLVTASDTDCLNLNDDVSFSGEAGTLCDGSGASANVQTA